MEPREILEKVKEIINPYLTQNNYELVEIIYRRESGRMVLRLLVDKVGGINAEECSQLNQMLGERLDELDIMPESYTLEVSSPGLDRPLKNEADFRRVKSQKVRLRLSVPQKGRYEVTGIIVEASPENVRVELEDKTTLDIPYQQIQNAKLEVKF